MEHIGSFHEQGDGIGAPYQHDGDLKFAKSKDGWGYGYGTGGVTGNGQGDGELACDAPIHQFVLTVAACTFDDFPRVMADRLAPRIWTSS